MTAAHVTVQVLMKQRGATQWSSLIGGHHVDWLKTCTLDEIPPAECPTDEWAKPGWQVCGWNLPDGFSVPSGAADLENIPAMPVRPCSTLRAPSLCRYFN